MLKAELKEMADSLLEQVEELNREREIFYNQFGMSPGEADDLKRELEQLREKNSELESMNHSLSEQLDDLYEEKEYLLKKYPDFSADMVESMEQQLIMLYEQKEQAQENTDVVASESAAEDTGVKRNYENSDIDVDKAQRASWQETLSRGGVLFHNCTVNIHN